MYEFIAVTSSGDLLKGGRVTCCAVHYGKYFADMGEDVVAVWAIKERQPKNRKQTR